MTVKEARARFKLKDTDTLDRWGIEELFGAISDYLFKSSISIFDRKEAELDLEALKVLRKECLTNH